MLMEPSFEMQALLDATVDAVIMIDHRGRVEMFNRAAVQLFGYTASEMIGRNVSVLMTDGDRHQHDAHMQRYQQGGPAHIIGIGRDVEARRQDGSVFPAHLSVGRIAGTDPPRYIGLLHDISARKRAERDAHEARERMMHVSRLATMGEMAAGISHELNQPLTAIATTAQACTRIMAGADSDLDEIRGALERIAAQALRAGEIIRRLRNLVRRRESELAPADINAVINELGALTMADARANDVRVSVELTPALPTVMMDRIQIQQVLLNLLRNSIDALQSMPAGNKQLSVKTSAPQRNRVVVSVSDTGPGVAAEMLDHLFTPFATTKSDGTGLGLAISRTIIEAHHGKLAYHSLEPTGACFTITLPTMEPPA
jgi:two-component system, LuxR family, sensor kinase FixL